MAQSTQPGSTTLAWWMQTTEYTCSESSLMVALHELSGMAMSAEVERGWWKRMLPWYLKPLEKILQEKVGTPPRCLADCVQERVHNVKCEYVVWLKNTNGLGSRAAFIAFMSYLHDFILAFTMLLWPPTRYRFHKPTVLEVRQYLDQKPGCRVLLVIVIPGGYVHFVMIRRAGDMIAVMDPYNHKSPAYFENTQPYTSRENENFFYTEAQFDTWFGPRLYGYAMRLTAKA